MTWQELERKAAEAYYKGKAILEEFKDKDLPKEKEQEVDGYFNECDDWKRQADLAKKSHDYDKYFNEPQHKHPVAVPEGKSIQAPITATAMDLHSAGELELKHLLTARRKYLKAGDEVYSGGRLTPEEAKALSSLSDPEGGFVLTTQEISTMVTKRRNAVKIRQYATVIQTSASEVTVPYFNYEPTAIAKTAEGATKPTEDPSNLFGKIRFSPIKIAVILPMPEELVEDAMFDLEGFLTDWFSMIFKEKEENYFINGTGVNEPLGLLNAGLTTKQVSTADKLLGDDIFDVVYSLTEAYRSRGVWLMNKSIISHVRKLKEGDTTGAYLWQPSLQAGQPATLVGYPIVESEYFPAETPTSDPGDPLALFGDFSYYWIVDRVGFQVKRLVDGAYGEKDLIGVRMRERFDAAPVLKDPFVIMTAK